MKKLLFLFFTLTVSSYTYSQVTSFNNLPISRVLLVDMDNHQGIDNALTVPEGKLWYIQYISNVYGDQGTVYVQLGGYYVGLSEGAVLSEGTKVSQNSASTLNIIEYDLDAQTTALNTNDIKLDNKMQLFPNPTNSRLSLNSEKDYNIEVFDLTGRKIMEAQGNNLDMSNLSKATYIVKTFDKASKETYSYKVIRN
jgi:hypothetical protein